MRYWPDSGQGPFTTHISFSEDVQVNRTSIFARYDSGTNRWGAILEAYDAVDATTGVCTGNKLLPPATTPLSILEDYSTRTSETYPVPLANTLTIIDASDVGEMVADMGTFSDPIQTPSSHPDNLTTLDTTGVFALGTGNSGNNRAPVIIDYDFVSARCLSWHVFQYEDGVNLGDGQVDFGITSSYLGPMLLNCYSLSLGSTVFTDDNDNGQQDGSEAGIAGVKVELYTSTQTPGTDVPFATATTDANGDYHFEGLAEGDYVVYIPTPPASAPTSSSVTSTTDDNVDGDNNGSQPGGSGTPVTSPVITLSAGNEPVNGSGANDEADQGANTTGYKQDDADGDSDGNMTVDFGFVKLGDWGDLPDGNATVSPNYNTDGTGTAGPSHVIKATLKMGAAIDREITGIPSADAEGDDNDGTPDDEDGVTLPTFVAGAPGTVAVNVTNNTGSAAYVYGFIDWNGDGSFDDPGEAISTTVPTGTSGGTALLTFDVPAGADTAQQLGARFRLSTDTGLGPDGRASDGEVEDYLTTVTPVLALGSFIWNDLNGDGTQDTNEPGIAGATVRLLDSSNNPVTADAAGNPLLPVTTGSDGLYQFQNLAAGDYKVEVTMPTGYVPTASQWGGAINGSTTTNVSNTDSNIDSNPSAGVYRSGVITLTNNGEPTGEIQADGSADNPGSANADDNNGNMTVDFGFVKPAAIGNYVWVDENSDGVQDEGEPGIPGVVVQLTPPARVNLGNGAGVAITTVTDSHGGYLFPNLPPLASGEQYVVTIPTDNWSSGKPLEGMFQTPLSTGDAANGDFGNKDDGSNDGSGSTSGYVISTLGPGEENLTADFGYNHNTNVEVNNGIGNAALGDRVWIDSDGDGVQDPNEVGVSGVTVSLLTDDNDDGIYGGAGDNAATTTATDGNGYYLFDNLAPGGYVVKVTDSATASHDILNTGTYTQTGDPDHFGTSSLNVLPGGKAADNLTTIPVVLAPGDVFLNADFGYQPTTAALGSIGDTVFFDADADGNGPSMTDIDQPNGQNGASAVTQGAGGAADATDYGIAGVSVALIKDSNGNGVWDAGEPIIATDVTDSNGQYLFEGLAIADGAGTDDYLVWVNDTDNVLAGLTGTYDNDGGRPSTASGAPNNAVAAGAILGLSAVQNLDDDATAANAVRSQDFGYSASSPVGSIGDTVWHDVDGAGGDQSTQGAEPGLPGVTVKLYNDPTPANPASGDEVLVATTTTDGSGNYLFSNLPLGSYAVEVDAATLPGGSTWSQTYDQDGPLDNRSGTTITEAVPHDRLQDFSYTKTSPVLYSVGDTIWYDSDSSGGDQGTQGTDPGIAGVTVVLLDSSGAVVDTAVTDGNGNYLFTDLPAGGYEVVVDTTTLPGYVSTTSTYERDGADTGSRTTLILGPSNEQNPRDLDFSYPPATAPTSGTIGDTVWLDLDGSGGNQTTQGTEPGLPNVTVRIYVDTDGDGTPDDINNPLKTTVTDENGNYLFTDLPLTDAVGNAGYVVIVDSGTLPSYVDSKPSYDPDGGDDSRSAVELSVAGPVNLDQDFSYPPLKARGAIGDTVWFDSDASGGDQTTQGDEPGIEGVAMELLDSSGNVIATTTTNENGSYYFGNLPLDETYQVRVAASNFASGGVLEGMDNTYDPDSPAPPGLGDDLGPQITLTAAAPVNLDQDFSYVGASSSRGSIGNRIWLDQNADGIWDGTNGPDGLPGTDDDETGIGDVTVDLYRDLNGNGVVDPGEPLIGRTKTASDGTYLFGNLPIVGNGDADPQAEYVVDVTDEAGILSGYWHSLSASQDPSTGISGDTAEDAADNSKSDPFAVEIGSGAANSQPEPNNLNVDFGYYVEPAATGNYVWMDENRNGIQDTNEVKIDGVVVTLTIEYASGPDVVLKTVTGDDPSTAAVEKGWYSFGNLLLDEDHNESGTATLPKYTLSVGTSQSALAGLFTTVLNVDSNGKDSEDADDPDGVVAVTKQGRTDTVQRSDPTTEPQQAWNDFGFYCESDWGDLPQGTNENPGDLGKDYLYPVQLNLDGGRHCTTPGLTIGSGVTIETDGQNGFDATRDTDDGLTWATDAAYDDVSDIFTVNATVVNSTTVDAQLVGWIDFNQDGDVDDAGERSQPDLVGQTDGTFTSGNIPAGNGDATPRAVTLQWTGVDLALNTTLNLHSRYRLTLDPSFFSDSSPDPDRWVNSGEVEDYYGPITTLPVTIAYVDSERGGDEVTFLWQTATETGNAGFNILVETAEGLVQLNGQLIPSKVIDSVEVTDYEVTLATGATAFYIQEVGVDGRVDMIGPFQVGQEYGSRTDTGETDSSDAGSDNTIFLPSIINQ